MYNRFLKYLMDNDPDKVLSRRGIKIRKVINPIVRKAAAKMAPYNFELVRKEPIPTDRPVIFAPTHGFKDDFAYTLKAIDTHVYALTGSLPVMYQTFDGISLWLNGIIVVDRMDRESRHAAVDKMVSAIQKGANLALYPEGVWNKSPNLLILPLFSGIYKVAKETGAVVVPVATELEGDTCYVIVEKAFDITEYSQEEGLCILRDKMASMKWELMEKYSTTTRQELLKGQTSEDYWKAYMDERMAEVDAWDMEAENNAHYKAPNITPPAEAFDFLTEIEWNRNNAFLARSHAEYERRKWGQREEYYMLQ